MAPILRCKMCKFCLKKICYRCGDIAFFSKVYFLSVHPAETLSGGHAHHFSRVVVGWLLLIFEGYF